VLRDARIVPNVSQTAADLSTVISLVGAQRGVAILPASAVKHSLRQSSPVTLSAIFQCLKLHLFAINAFARQSWLQRVVGCLRFSYPDSGRPLARRASHKALRSSPSCHTTDVRHRC